nr:hypothetical protein [Tanacetum cinerariifolium]
AACLAEPAVGQMSAIDVDELCRGGLVGVTVGVAGCRRWSAGLGIQRCAGSCQRGDGQGLAQRPTGVENDHGDVPEKVLFEVFDVERTAPIRLGRGSVQSGRIFYAWAFLDLRLPGHQSGA